MTASVPLPPWAEAILDYWFGPPDGEGYGGYRKAWFEVDSALDAEVTQRFLADHEAAAAGRLAGVEGHPRARLAHVLLLDQVPRNAFRGSARAFATDGLALGQSKAAIAAGADAALIPVERLFLYMPFQHAEDRAEQDRSVALYTSLGNEEWLDFARRHREIVERFGRFPHRNAALGRVTTEEEAAFLEQPGSSF